MVSKLRSENFSDLKNRIDLFSKTNLTSSEANTKKKIIEPLLEMLGWDFSGNEVHLEYPVNIGTRTHYVDYALILEGKTIVFVEAKAFDTELTEVDSNQIISYGKIDDVRWTALSNGRIMKIFDTSAGRSEKECLIGEVNLKQLPRNVEVLMLIHRDSILTGEIEKAVKRLAATRKAITNLRKRRDKLAEEFETSILKITGELVKQRVQNISVQLVNQAIQLFETQAELKPGAITSEPIQVISRKELSQKVPGEVLLTSSRPAGVEFLKKYNAWGFINISRTRKPQYFALYVGAPESSVLYFGEIDSITKPIQSREEIKMIQEEDMGEPFPTGKRVIHLKRGSLVKFKDPIPLESRRRGLRGKKYTTLEKMINARKLSEL